MDKHFDHAAHEPEIYRLWEENGVFNPDNLPTANNNRPFSIIMPPPNANDPLHIGHAMFVALEDVLIRYHRMIGDDTVWIPGTDHAGIETQFVFEKKLQKEGKSRFNFDRKTLYQMIWDYVQENSGVAIEQMKSLGASADWSRYKFTLDPDVVEKVLDTFEKMHTDGLIYRGRELVNFCTHCGTSYSELEVVHKEQVSPLYYVKYPLAEKPSKFITVATVRPEPIFIDTHLAVNPNDPKRKHLVGQEALNPITGERMPIISDEYVDPEFGTGIVKITPAHDPNDFRVAKKHSLPIREAINTRGKITEAGGKYAGMSVAEARKAVVADLTAAGLIEKIDEKYVNRVGTCYRCGRVIEPLPMAQFFVKVKDSQNNLTEKVLALLDEKKVKIHGAGREKILRHWLDNLYDWNISRQITWGIPIPVWYEIKGYENDIEVGFINDSGEYVYGSLANLLNDYQLSEIKKGLQQVVAAENVPYIISRTEPAAKEYLPETDTFDTWFSSSQWPVLTLKTNKTGDFDRFYPTNVMETAYDILMFWVMRMLLMGVYLTGQAPFRDVYLHGLIRDKKGQKMSKSKGNTINPLSMSETYGTDALRMALIVRSTAGQDKNIDERDFIAMRNFANKIWNASRYIIMRFSQNPQYILYRGQKPTSSDTVGDTNSNFHLQLEEKAWDLSRSLQNLRLGVAADQVYNDFWHWFCDECIEENKAGKLPDEAILDGLITFLKLLHPFMPFVTERVWQELRAAELVSEPLLITTSWPVDIHDQKDNQT
jgi:valyl-tRNA synthetase